MNFCSNSWVSLWKKKTIQQVKPKYYWNEGNWGFLLCLSQIDSDCLRWRVHGDLLQPRRFPLPVCHLLELQQSALSKGDVPARLLNLNVWNIWIYESLRPTEYFSALHCPKWQHSLKLCMKFHLILLYSCYHTLGLNITFLSQNAKLIYHNAPPGEIFYRSLSKTRVFYVHVHTIFILLLSSWKIPSVCNASDIIAGMPTEYDTYANLHPAVEKHTQGFHYHIH